jgi:hypothetical protein
MTGGKFPLKASQTRLENNIEIDLMAYSENVLTIQRGNCSNIMSMLPSGMMLDEVFHLC